MDDTNKKGTEGVTIEEQDGSRSEREVGCGTEIENLRREIDAKETEARQNYERLLRQAAELENFKKRAAKEKEEIIRYGNESLIRDLLPILDNLERAVSYAGGGGNGTPLLEGVEMTLKSFLDVLGKHGVKQVSAKGELFDPKIHEAIAQVETKEFLPNSVVEEHHKGYFLLDRLLRPALVSTAKPPPGEGDKGGDGEVENKGNDD
jgi:molecular chaperone GrpE